jgi:hypothetical protein
MVWTTRDFSVKIKMIVPHGFENWSSKDQLEYTKSGLKNDIVVLSVKGVTERTPSLFEKGGE